MDPARISWSSRCTHRRLAVAQNRKSIAQQRTDAVGRLKQDKRVALRGFRLQETLPGAGLPRRESLKRVTRTRKSGQDQRGWRCARSREHFESMACVNHSIDQAVSRIANAGIPPIAYQAHAQPFPEQTQNSRLDTLLVVLVIGEKGARFFDLVALGRFAGSFACPRTPARRPPPIRAVPCA